MMFGNIRAFVKNSFCDWPGKVTTVLFLGGCNFKCPTCHNYELIYKKDPEIDFKSITDHLENNLKWLDGIVISGGEPTIDSQIYDLTEFLSKNYLPVKLDSNGSNPVVIENLMDNVQKFSIDVKGPWNKYPELTGNCISKEKIKNCFDHIFFLAQRSPEKFEFRTTFVPQLTNDDLEVVKSYLPNQFTLKIQKYQEV